MKLLKVWKRSDKKSNVFSFSSFGKDKYEGTECINSVPQKPVEKDKWCKTRTPRWKDERKYRRK